ncbi:hypothetical protein DMX62_26695 [Escherichia coli]|nr:hypothetical protein [Escherichia coli]
MIISLRKIKMNLFFTVVSQLAFDEFNYRYVKKDCKCFFKFFAGVKALEIKERASKVFPK